MAKLGYGTVGSNNLAAAKGFYDGLLGAIGMAGVYEHPSGGRLYGSNGTLGFGVLGPHNGEPATVGNGSMFAFAFPSRAEVDAFHAKALELGGTCEGPPGERGPKMYFAYFRDLDGNKLCGYSIG